MPRVGYYWEPGVGKTGASTHQALYYRAEHGTQQWLVLMPPILLEQWQRWLHSVTDLSTGKPLTTTLYAGTPKQRAVLDLNADFILTSYGLLKNDFERLHAHFETRRTGVIADEATAIKNTASDTHKAVAMIAEGRELMLLTGTPINKPGDSFAYLKLVAPGVYRNRRQFDRLHVLETDDYGNVEKWCNLDVLAENMRINTDRLLLREARADMKEPLFTPINYKLDPAHLKLYRRIAEERLVEFEGGKEIDAISASALRSALQQIVVNWGEFDDNPSRVPAILDMIEEVLEELGDKKLVIAAHFVRTNAYLHRVLAKYGAVAVYGDVSKKDKQAAIQRFIRDPSCRVILLQPSSAGLGVDGLQHVCSDMLVVEAPTTPTPFQQVIARLDRDGQTEPVHIRIAIAAGTVQVKMFRSLLDNDELANSVQGGYKNLRSSVYGTD
jgi:SNF2 family DNA or RNA helicase